MSTPSSDALRVANAILAGAKQGSIRWYGANDGGIFMWQHRRVPEVAAIIDAGLTALRAENEALRAALTITEAYWAECEKANRACGKYVIAEAIRHEARAALAKRTP